MWLAGWLYDEQYFPLRFLGPVGGYVGWLVRLYIRCISCIRVLLRAGAGAETGWIDVNTVLFYGLVHVHGAGLYLRSVYLITLLACSEPVVGTCVYG